MKIHIILFSILFLLLNSCGSADDYDYASVTIINNTDKTVTVYHTEDEHVHMSLLGSSNDEVKVVQDELDIAPAASSTVHIQLHPWGGEFSVVYSGIVLSYDVGFNSMEIELLTDDFIGPTAKELQL